MIGVIVIGVRIGRQRNQSAVVFERRAELERS